MWPIYFQQTGKPGEDPGNHLTEIEVLYPFVGIKKGEGYYFHTLRPLYNYEHDQAKLQSRLQYLWPLGLQANFEGQSWLHRFWPIFQHSETLHGGSDDKTVHGWVLPFFFWGSDPDEGPYFGFFPIGGVTHEIFGDTFSWVAFPLFSYYRQEEFKRYNILWPFFSYGSTPDGDKKSVRVWPFWVRKSEEDAYQYNYLLWPFVRWGHQQWTTLDGEERVRRYHAFHPFFSAQVLRDEEGEVISWQRQVLLFTQRDDRREEGTSWSFLFSLLRYQNISDKYELKIFPFYWRSKGYPWGKDRPDRYKDRRIILWPLVWFLSDTISPGEHYSHFVLAPFIWWYKTLYVKSGTIDNSFTIWPLFTRQKQMDGAKHFYVLSHGWKDSTGGYKRNYRPFFDFFQYHSFPDGRRETRFLWRLYHHIRSPEGRYLSIPFVFTLDSLGDPGADGKKSVSLLGGLLKYYWWDEDDQWRLFFISF
jgi:hypothetical protein